MVIQEKPLRHWIDNFYGYGSWHAKFWLVSYEDGGGDLPEEVAEKLNYFHNVHGSSTEATLCDIRDLYQHASIYWDGPKADLFTNLYDYRFGTQATLNGVWKNLITFTYGYRGDELPDLLTYQKNQFAAPALQHEALIKLYPLPSSHHHGWYYSWLDMPQFPFLKSRALYEQQVYADRMHTILQNISRYKPELVLMYGMNNINDLKKSVLAFFPEAKFKMVKAIKLQTPQHHRVDFNGTTLLITTQIPALRHNRVETGFDWLEFGKMVRVAGT
jgi:hypothetical protein